MADKFRTDIILIISSRRGIISVAIGGSGSRGTNEVTILIVIIVVFRISTKVVVAVGIIIDVIFGFFVNGIDASVILGVSFGCSIRLASGEGTVIIRSKMKKKMMIVAFEIIIDVVFGRIVIVVVVVVNCEDSTLSVRTPAVEIIIVGDEAKGPIINGNRVLDIDTSFV